MLKWRVGLILSHAPVGLLISDVPEIALLLPHQSIYFIYLINFQNLAIPAAIMRHRSADTSAVIPQRSGRSG